MRNLLRVGTHFLGRKSRKGLLSSCKSEAESQTSRFSCQLSFRLLWNPTVSTRSPKRLLIQNLMTPNHTLTIKNNITEPINLPELSFGPLRFSSQPQLHGFLVVFHQSNALRFVTEASYNKSHWRCEQSTNIVTLHINILRDSLFISTRKTYITFDYKPLTTSAIFATHYCSASLWQELETSFREALRSLSNYVRSPFTRYALKRI
jgi:hypothetical protein